ncbi:MAG: hypothetical protein HY738_12970 [Bacteroidia bacterium]|nr:hypothetical protein [Bacteroidia bacterium]
MCCKSINTARHRSVQYGNRKYNKTRTFTDINIKKESKIFSGITNPRFYFAHSYHLMMKNEADILCTTHYGYEFVSGFEKDNLIGLQFHPEKSHKFGMQLFRNFLILADEQL